MKNYFENNPKLYKFIQKFLSVIMVIIWLYLFILWLCLNVFIIISLAMLCYNKTTIVNLLISFGIIPLHILITMFYFKFWKYIKNFVYKETDKMKNFILTVSIIVAFYLYARLTAYVCAIMFFVGH